MMDSPLKTPLYDTHVEMGGRMVDFAGWLLPVRFAGITQEHLHTRAACSVFDVSHMGRLKITGNDCESFLNRICTRNLAGAEVGRSYYTHVCREDGGVLDDLIVSRFESHWGIVCNASNREKIVAWLDRHSRKEDVKVRDETLLTAMLAIQGPRTLELAQDTVNTGLSSIKRYGFRTFAVMGMPISVYRSGYTGEDGFEVVVPAGIVKMLAPRLLGTKKKPHPVIKPAGLGARDTLRIEAAMPLYGHELSEEVDSLTAGQGWCVDLSKDFLGAELMRKLKEQGLPRRLVGLELDGRRIARQHYKVYDERRVVGEVTSGTLSPTLGKSIAMAYVETSCTNEGTRLEVEVGGSPLTSRTGDARQESPGDSRNVKGRREAARVVKLPFYKRSR